MFRANALNKISSPEDLTRNIQIANYWYWLLLSIIGCFFIGLIVWSCVADISTRVRGSGIFLPEGGRIIDAGAPFTGTIDKILRNAGDYVEKGDVIAQFSSSTREKELNTTRQNLALEKQLHQQHGQNVAEEQKRRKQNLESLFDNIQADIEATRLTVEETYKTHQDSLKLFNDNIITQTTLSNKRLAWTKSRNDLHALQTRIDRLKQTEFEKRSQENFRLTEFQHSIARHESRHEVALNNIRELSILAPVTGEVLEIKAPEGALLQAGTSFISIMTNTTKRSFTSIIMIEGTSKDESSGLLSLIQTNRHDSIEFIAYVNASNGKKISPGTEIQIEVDYLSRNEYGMVEGVVVKISDLPITAAGISSKLANKALVTQFTKTGSLYEVRVKLTRDLTSKNGLSWTSSRGAEENFISIGSLGNVEFILEKRKPITLLIPLLRSFFT